MRKRIMLKKFLLTLIFIIFFKIFDGLIHHDLVLGSEINMDTFEMEGDFQNNLIGIADCFFSSDWKKAMQQRQTIPNFVTGSDLLNLKLAFNRGTNVSLGLFARRMGWFRITGDTAQFYHDVSDINVTSPKLYELGIRSETFELLGLYKQQKFEIGKIKIIWEGDLFSCLNYQKIEAAGLGLLTLDSSDQRQIKIYADYQRTNTDYEELGWGTSFSWKTIVGLNATTELKLKVTNLPGIIFFPCLGHENGTVDSSLESIGPLAVYGSSQKKASWIILPVKTQFSLLYKTSGGMIEVQGFSLGDLFDVSTGYSYFINERLTSEMLFSPITNKLSIGFQSTKIKFKIVVDTGYGWIIEGVIISVKI